MAEVKHKWGKVDISEFDVKDTSGKASAIILFDIGKQEYEIVHQDFVLIYTRHVRIKILNKAGYDYANVVIKYLDRKGIEKIGDIDARSYWLNDKGKVESADLNSDLVFDENIDDFFHKRKFTIPSVKEGCIIEYKFKVTSENIFYLNGWRFQNELPTKYSELTNYIPEYFTFQTFERGALKIDQGEVNNTLKTAHFHVVHDVNDIFNMGKNRYNDFDIQMKMYETTLSESNIPALEHEPHLSSLINYSSSVNFYLTSVQFPESFNRRYSSTWKYLIEQLYDDEDFGKAFLNNNSISDLAKSLTIGIEDARKKIYIIYKYLSTSVQWNGIYNIYAGKKLKKVLDEHKGTSGEINLLLLQMLHAVEIEADPVLISTREHGDVQMAYPCLQQFDHFIVLVNTKEGKQYLDATDPFRAPGLLDEDDLNGTGLLAKKDLLEWVTISNVEKTRKVVSANCKLNGEGLMEINYDKSDYGYYAYNLRKDISAATSTAGYVNKKLSSSIPDVEILDQKFENLDSVDAPLKSHLKFSTHKFSSSMNNTIYIEPMINFMLKENPFTEKKRKLPVEFPNVFEETYYINIALPEGYTMKELPKSTVLKLPDDAAVFSYVAGLSDAMFQLKCTFKINSTYFDLLSYEDLREFYSKTIEKQNERLVIVKN